MIYNKIGRYNEIEKYHDMKYHKIRKYHQIGKYQMGKTKWVLGFLFKTHDFIVDCFYLK